MDSGKKVGSKLNGTPMCCPGELPRMSQLVRMEGNLDIIQVLMTDNYESVIEKENCHLTGFVHDEMH